MDYYTLLLALNSLADLFEKKKQLLRRSKGYRVVKRSGAKSYVVDNEYFYASLTRKPGKIIAKHLSEDIIPILMLLVRNHMEIGNKEKRVLLYIYVKKPIEKIMVKDKEIPVSQAQIINKIEEKLEALAPRIIQAIKHACINCEEKEGAQEQGTKCTYNCKNTILVDNEKAEMVDVVMGVYHSCAIIRENHFLYEGLP